MILQQYPTAIADLRTLFIALLLAVVSACGDDGAPSDTGAGDVAADTADDARNDVVDATEDVGDAGGDGAEDTTGADLADAGGDAVDDLADAGGADADANVIEDTGAPDVFSAVEVWEVPERPACGEGGYGWTALIPGPEEAGYDEELAELAERIERQYHGLNALATGGNADLIVPRSDITDREAIVEFVLSDAAETFEEFAGRSATTAVDAWSKTTGAFAGPGIAADAYRYATLRDQGADCDAVEEARQRLERGLDLLHLATAITGVEGVVARAVARRDFPGDGERETVPLFDEAGNPLPEEKNNGTWRADNSAEGEYSEWIWEDSCSRDQLVGWVMGMGAAWEVLRDDPTADPADMARLRDDARAIGAMLMQVGEEGYDLEIHDADGRLTYHAYLNEWAIDRVYNGLLRNGQHAMMALGIISALAAISEDETLRTYLREELLAERELDKIARDSVGFLNLGVTTNFSNFNMAFQGAWMAARYIDDVESLATVREAVIESLYEREGLPRQPSEQGQSFYDLVFAVAQGRATAWRPLDPRVGGGVIDEAMERGLETLAAFGPAPLFTAAVTNCDEAEIAALECLAVDGTTTLTLETARGHNDEVVATEVVPFAVRPPSNFEWRSNPYRVNGGTTDALNPGSDFRFVYWAGRWLRQVE